MRGVLPALYCELHLADHIAFSVRSPREWRTWRLRPAGYKLQGLARWDLQCRILGVENSLAQAYFLTPLRHGWEGSSQGPGAAGDLLAERGVLGEARKQLRPAELLV